MPAIIHNLNAATSEPLGSDAQREAAARCFAVLVSCAHTASILGQLHHGKTPEQSGYLESATELHLTLLTHGRSLAQDLNILAAMVGCELIACGEQKGAQA